MPDETEKNSEIGKTVNEKGRPLYPKWVETEGGQRVRVMNADEEASLPKPKPSKKKGWDDK